MITEADIAHWQRHAPWPTLEQVEQDLVLSRLIVEIANHPLLGDELVFRGGTCLHKVWLDRPWRYSEDLDYVRRTAGGIGDILDAIREVAAITGFDRVHTDMRRHPKARLDATFVRGGRMRVKIELNTVERVSARPVPDTTSETLTAMVSDTTAAGATVYTDEARAYKPLASLGYCHAAVEHSARAFVRGDVHTYGIESLWSMFKRRDV